MHGLQTLQAINNAEVAFRESKKNTKVADVVEGFFVFIPNGYEVVYHDQDKYPEHPDRPVCSIEFRGEDSRGARFNVTPAKGPVACNRSLDEVVQLAAAYGVPADDVAGRLGKLFVSINQN
jgi:hypothetical protein